jgi:pyrroloquinoline quinone (PQQ) biosynthesis protein C
MQKAALQALQFKCDLLWGMLDAIDRKTRKQT